MSVPHKATTFLNVIDCFLVFYLIPSFGTWASLGTLLQPVRQHLPFVRPSWTYSLSQSRMFKFTEGLLHFDIEQAIEFFTCLASPYFNSLLLIFCFFYTLLPINVYSLHLWIMCRCICGSLASPRITRYFVFLQLVFIQFASFASMSFPIISLSSSAIIIGSVQFYILD